ncbi:MAG: RNA 2',3'-cyclic phosphodiesterase [Robiginitomaculum sp.]
MILFAAIPIPDDIARQIKPVQKGVEGARWRRAEQLHITIGYFGDIDDERAQMLDDEIAREPLQGFALTLKGCGHFGKNNPHALWAGVDDSAPLTKLHSHCRRAARAANIIMPARVFTPHLTLAYLPKTSPEHLVTALERLAIFKRGMVDFKVGPFWVDGFSLYSSHRKKKGGNAYRIEADYPLIGSRL